VVLTLALALVGFAEASILVKIIAPGFVGTQRELTVALTRVLVFTIVMMALSSWATAVLNSRHHFTVPALISLPFNAIIILAAIFLGTRYGILVVAYATLFAVLSQALLQLVPIIRGGFRYRG